MHKVPHAEFQKFSDISYRALIKGALKSQGTTADGENVLVHVSK